MSYEGGGGSSASPGIGFPQLAACLLIGYLFFRWYNSSPPPPNTGTEFTSSSTAAVASRRPLSAQDLARLQNRAEIVHGMFPQISLSSIKWELQKNGGSVEITTEKILAQGFLPEPPPSTIPSGSGSAPRSRVPTPATGAVAAPAGGTPSTSNSTSKPYTDLITRYNLSDKLASASSAEVETEEEAQGSGKSSAWSQNKQERQALMQKRREEMILKARRKMEEKEKAS